MYASQFVMIVASGGSYAEVDIYKTMVVSIASETSDMSLCREVSETLIPYSSKNEI